MALSKKVKMKNKNIFSVTIVVAVISLLSCNTAPGPLKVGVDNCYFCKMTISDAKFGAEIVTNKGKQFKFDDVHCLIGYLKTNDLQQAAIKDIYITDFTGNHYLINIKLALLLKSDALRSPMGGNVAAFENADSLKFMQQHYRGAVVNWNELIKH
jgi:copper chaperone NosL